MLFRGQTLGKYKIAAPLGSGGFGVVYLARDTWIDKEVAIKVPHKQNLNFTELLREPRLLAALDHPNIVSITTAEKQENVFFIVMEYVEGKTLEDVITDGGALDPDLAVDLFPADMPGRGPRPPAGSDPSGPPSRRTSLVSHAGVLKVADFGTSRFLEIAAHSTTVIGSPPYMAPEQFDGKAVFASDLYSLRRDDVSDADRRRFRTTRQHRVISAGFGAASWSVRRDCESLRFQNALSDIVMTAMAPDIPNRYQRADDIC